MRALSDCGLFALISVIAYLLLGAIPTYKVALKSNWGRYDTVWPYWVVFEILLFYIRTDYPFFELWVGDRWGYATIIELDKENDTVTFDVPIYFEPHLWRLHG